MELIPVLLLFGDGTGCLWKSSFTVTIHKDGRYVLTVTGSDAEGSVNLIKKCGVINDRSEKKY